jgi:hypothetical protein
MNTYVITIVNEDTGLDTYVKVNSNWFQREDFEIVSDLRELQERISGVVKVKDYTHEKDLIDLQEGEEANYPFQEN